VLVQLQIDNGTNSETFAIDTTRSALNHHDMTYYSCHVTHAGGIYTSSLNDSGTFPLNLGHRHPKQRDHEGYCSPMPRSLPAGTPQKTRGKTKGNRSIRCIPGGNEAIWDEELHTALIEGICFWPPTT